MNIGVRRGEGVLWLIGYAETATEIDVPQPDALVTQAADQMQNALEGINERPGIGQLRADMTVDADDMQMWHAGGLAVVLQGRVDRDAELVLPQSGGYVGMRAGIHVRIDAQCHRSGQAAVPGHFIQPVELAFRFDIEAADADLQRPVNFIGAFPDAGEHHACRIAAGHQDALQFAHRDNVKSGAESCQHLQYREVGIRFDRIADEVGMAGERRVEDTPVPFQGGA